MEKRNRFYRIIIKIAIYTIIFGSVLKIPGIEFGGMTFNVFRIIIPILALMIFVFSYALIKLNKKGTFLFFLILIMIWIVWGIVLLIFSEYADIKGGLKEIIALIYLLLIVYIFWNCGKNVDINDILFSVRICVIILILLSLFEMFTGFHLYTSIFSNDIQRIDGSGIFIFGFELKMSTGVFYNQNDLCAFLVIFIPLFYVGIKNVSLIKKLIRLAVVACILIIFMVCDANIAIYVFIISFVVFSLLRFSIKQLIIELFVVLIVGLVFMREVIERIINTFVEQYSNIEGAVGSFYKRLEIYMDSICATGKTSGIGIGPASFSNYFQQNPSGSGLVDPHNFWLEVLLEYGVIIFILLMILLIRLMNHSRRLYCVTLDTNALCSYIMLWSFAFACIIPSSFLQNPYLGLVFGIAIIISEEYIKKQNIINSNRQFISLK